MLPRPEENLAGPIGVEGSRFRLPEASGTPPGAASSAPPRKERFENSPVNVYRTWTDAEER